MKERTNEIKDDVDEGYEEHHVAKLVIGEIGDLDSGSDSWLAMTVLIESAEHHIDEEKGTLSVGEGLH